MKNHFEIVSYGFDFNVFLKIEIDAKNIVKDAKKVEWFYYQKCEKLS